MRSLLLPLLVLLFAVIGTAQTNSDFEFFPYYNQELMEDLRISDAQVTQMQALDKEIGQRYTDLNNALLYHEDYQAKRQKIEADRQKSVASILTPEQKTYYDQFQASIEAEQQQDRLQSYTEMYLNLYNYLQISFEQAEKIAKYDVGLYDGQYKKHGYKPGKELLLRDVLTEEQWNTYSEKDVKEDFTVKSSGSLANYEPDYERLSKKMQEYNELIKNYYVPQRAQIRADFNEHITGSDQKTIDYLRSVYDELAVNFETEYQTISYGVNKPFQYDEHWRENMQLKYDHILENGQSVVKALLRKDRETFNLAKELAVRYDAQIDATQDQLEALKKNYRGHLSDISIKYASGKVIRVVGNPNPEPEEPKNYQTDKVELERNLAFLLIGDQVEETATFSAKASQPSAYPLPATTTQTLEFELKQAGEATIDIVDAAGKLIKQVYKGELNAGTQRREVNLTEISQTVFFYRITTNDEITLLKSAKL